jgi:hypothetical protein
MDRSRRAPRVTLAARVEGLAQYREDVRVLDLSPNGALVESERMLERDSPLSLQITLGDGAAPLVVRGRVIHSSKADAEQYRSGIRFDALPAEKRDRIQEFLRSSLKLERREEPRVFVGQAAELKEEVEIRVVNLSLFGGLFSVAHPLEFESEHDFVFSLPQGDVHARGVVRHCEAWVRARAAVVFRLGVEFTNLTGIDRDRVVAYLEEQIQAS